MLLTESVKISSSANVADFLLEGKDESCPALYLLDGVTTYGALRRSAASVAAHLVHLGARKGQRCIVLGENSLFWVSAYLGTLKAGLVSVPLATTVTPQELEYVIATTGARFAFVQWRFALKHRDCFKGLQILLDQNEVEGLSAAKFSDIQIGVSSTTEYPECEPADLAALMFTSGSTGQPRGVMITHQNIKANTESIAEYLQLSESDRVMAVLPFHYCFGTSLLHTHLYAGGSLVVDNRFMYHEAILDRMEETECTGFAGVPSHYQILLRKSSLRKRKFAHLRYVQQAGGNLAPVFIQELREALPTTQVFVMYGQTEATARLSYLPPDRLGTKLGSIGKGIPGVRLRVLNPEGDEVKPGEVGEIVAEGENISPGYWKLPEDTARTFRDGKLYTGDLATIDEDGFIFIVDRAKDFLKCGGKRVSCVQIEETLLELDELLEAAVVGMPDEILGEAVKAFLVPRNEDSSGLEGRVRVFCAQRLSQTLIPREIVFLKSLPKNSAGKVLKQKLKQ